MPGPAQIEVLSPVDLDAARLRGRGEPVASGPLLQAPRRARVVGPVEAEGRTTPRILVVAKAAVPGAVNHERFGDARELPVPGHPQPQVIVDGQIELRVEPADLIEHGPADHDRRKADGVV